VTPTRDESDEPATVGVPASWLPTLAAIHASPQKAVLAVTGGGSTAISALLAVPGASATVLEARVPYVAPALAEWLGGVPEQAASAGTALSMACAAWTRAAALAPDEAGTNLGVACTASLASDRPKRGDHRIHVACQSATRTRLASLTLAKGARDRGSEERVATALVLRTLAQACGVDPGFDLPLAGDEHVEADEQIAAPPLADVWLGHSAGVWSLPGGELTDSVDPLPRGLLCGSFDPLHDGHEGLRVAAEKALGGPVFFELTVRNADKPPLDYLRLEQRRAQFTGTPLRVSGQANFVDKAHHLPGTTFVVGADTAVRIVEPRFYGGGEVGVVEALASLRRSGASFLVAGRGSEEGFRTLADISIPAGFEDLFSEIPESAFRADISSTEIRRRRSDDA
jgi:nicotinamide mononucleotide (NMN) deamidase PncC